MNPSISPLETPEYPPSSDMSELDSLSDSDWLDISSNRESDDNDSVISGDSDRDEAGLMPLSRRSSMSVGSSREGEIEAWEGFVDDSGDEEHRNIESEMHVAPPTADIDDLAPGTSPSAASSQHDPAEEQRVKEALDQSLISTLSASRSSSTSTHNSLRDLRLSFPDPLTSSHDELNRSYDDVSPSETTFTSTDDATGSGDVTTEFPVAALCKEDPGSFTTTPEVTKHEVRVYSGDSRAGFEVVLYGSPSSIKWSFVQDLLRKAVLVSGTTICTDKSTRYLHIESQIDESLSISEFLPVHDRTESSLPFAAPVSQALIKRPSLAIVYLPSALHALPEHTFYLPVLLPGASSMELELARNAARDHWASLSISDNKLVRLTDTDSPILDSRDVAEVHRMRVHRLLQRLISEGKKSPLRTISEHLSPVHAVTLFALMSLIVGFAMNTAFRRSSTPTPTSPIASASVSSTFWGMFGPEVNHTSVFATTARANAPVVATPYISASHKDFSLSIFNPGSTSLAITSDRKPAIASTSATPAIIHCRTSTWTDKVKSAKDVIVRPTTQLLSVDAKPSMVLTSPVRNVAGPSGTKSTSLSLVVNSLTEVLDVRVKALRSDLDELVESLDELSRAIRRQTKAKVQQSKGKAKEIRETVQYRHDRARGKAKELKKKGEVFLSSASEQFMGRTTIARKKARDISNSLATLDAWRAYQAAHAEWSSKLKEKGKDGARGRNRKGSCGRGGKVEHQQRSSFFSYGEVYFL